MISWIIFLGITFSICFVYHLIDHFLFPNIVVDLANTQQTNTQQTNTQQANTQQTNTQQTNTQQANTQQSDGYSANQSDKDLDQIMENLDFGMNQKNEIKGVIAQPNISIETIINQINHAFSKSEKSKNLFIKNIQSEFKEYQMKEVGSGLYEIIVNGNKYIFFNPLEDRPLPAIVFKAYQITHLDQVKNFKKYKKLALMTNHHSSSFESYGEFETEMIKKFDQTLELIDEVKQIILSYMNETLVQKYPKEQFDQELIQRVTAILNRREINDSVHLQAFPGSELMALKIGSFSQYVLFYPKPQVSHLGQYYNHPIQSTWLIKEIKSVYFANQAHQLIGQIEYKDPSSAPVIHRVKQIAQNSIKYAAFEIAHLSFKKEWTALETEIWNSHFSQFFEIKLFNQHYVLFDSQSEMKIYISPAPDTIQQHISPKLLEPANPSYSFEIIDIVELAEVNKSLLPNPNQYSLSELVEATISKGKYKHE